MTNFCTSCGKALADSAAFCTGCGTPAPAAAPQTAPVQQTPVAPAAPTAEPAGALYRPAPLVTGGVPEPGSRYEPLSTGGYVGAMLLMCIPVLGQLLTVVWACGGCRKLNKRNLARAMLIFLLISLVLGAVLYFAGRALWGNVLETAGLSGLTGQPDGLGGLKDALGQLQSLKELQLPPA